MKLSSCVSRLDAAQRQKRAVGELLVEEAENINDEDLGQ